MRTSLRASGRTAAIPDRLKPCDPRLFQGPAFWLASESPDAPEDSVASEALLPPVHAAVALFVYQRAQHKPGARGFPEYPFAKLKCCHEHLYRERDPVNEWFVYIRHPW